MRSNGPLLVYTYVSTIDVCFDDIPIVYVLRILFCFNNNDDLMTCFNVYVRMADVSMTLGLMVHCFDDICHDYARFDAILYEW